MTNLALESEQVAIPKAKTIGQDIGGAKELLKLKEEDWLDGSKVDDRDVEPPRRQPAQEALICGDECGVLALGESEIYAVVDGVSQAPRHVHRAW